MDNTLTIRVDFVSDDELRNVYAYMDVKESIQLNIVALHTNPGDDYAEDDTPEGAKRAVTSLAEDLEMDRYGFIEDWKDLRDTLAYVPINSSSGVSEEDFKEIILEIPIKWNKYNVTVTGYIRVYQR